MRKNVQCCIGLAKLDPLESNHRESDIRIEMINLIKFCFFICLVLVNV